MRWVKIAILVLVLILCLVMAQDTHLQYKHNSLVQVDQK